VVDFLPQRTRRKYKERKDFIEKLGNNLIKRNLRSFKNFVSFWVTQKKPGNSRYPASIIGD